MGGDFEAVRQAFARAARGEGGREALKMFEHFPEELFGQRGGPKIMSA